MRGKLVLTSSQPEAVRRRSPSAAIGAAGIVSWAQNQRTAWWGEDESLVRWGHLDTFGEHPTFAFMVSPAARAPGRSGCARGETVRLRAEVEAGREPGRLSDPDRGHPRPRPRPGDRLFLPPRPSLAGRQRQCQRLRRHPRGRAHAQPADRAAARCRGRERTIRFIWPCEIEGTIALLNARPEFARRTLATIHLDMIGGNTEITKSILRVEGSPPSLPSFVADVGFAFAHWVNAQSLRFADTGAAALPLLDPDGDRRALQAEIGGFYEGSDHQVWAEGSWRIPVIYIADWPDRYIHTQRDVPDNLDPTKMRRAIFIAAASGWYLANVGHGATCRRRSPSGELDAGGGDERAAEALRRRRRRRGGDRAALAPLSPVRAGGDRFARPVRAVPSSGERRLLTQLARRRPGRAVRPGLSPRPQRGADGRLRL